MMPLEAISLTKAACWSPVAQFEHKPGKIVCVGRNYVNHAKELNHEVPNEPMLFIKPSSALQSLHQPVLISENLGKVHYEAELAFLIGQPLSKATPEAVMPALAGVGLALDLTLREVQSELKAKGLPWEKAKSFDGACAVSSFFSAPASAKAIEVMGFSMQINNKLAQQGQADQMIFSVPYLISYISHWFRLVPGDLVLTGTPEGVGVLNDQDQLRFELLGCSLITKVKAI